MVVHGTWSRTRIGNVLDLSQLRLQVGNAAPVVGQRRDDHDDQQGGNDQAGNQSAVGGGSLLTALTLVAQRRVDWNVAFIAYQKKSIRISKLMTYYINDTTLDS